MGYMTITPDLYLQGDSAKWKNWQAMYIDVKTCEDCRTKHGKIYSFNAERYQGEHERCRCFIAPMRTKEVGSATDKGFDGADAWLMYRNRLPDYYVTKEDAKAKGYRRKKNNLADVLPGYMIGGDIFLNDKGKLPYAPNRTWYEADIDYTYGKRNLKRIIYSSDGLIFITEDHYQTFSRKLCRRNHNLFRIFV